MTTYVNRRSFIAGSLAAGTSGLTVPLAHAEEVGKWDAVADVVIVGYGGAGAAAAISAADKGATVIILDKQLESEIVNNTRMSGGIFHCPDKDGDKKALFEYSKAMFSGENLPWKEEGEQEEFSNELAEAWVRYAPENVDFMKSLDPDFKAVFTPQAHGAAFPNFPGAKECGYQSYKSMYVPRIKDGNKSVWKLPKNETHSGEAFFLCLREGIAKRSDKITELFGYKAEHLLKNKEGVVDGVVVTTTTGKVLKIKARKGVILASGGYEYNRAMRKAFLEGPGITGWAFYGALCNTGDGIEMGQEIGAGLAKVSACCSRVIIVTNRRENGMRVGCVTPTVGNKNTIVVDNYGRRYQAETKITDDPSRYFFYREAVKFDIDDLSYPRTPSWLIFDETMRAAKPLINLGNSVVGYGIVDWSRDNLSAVEEGLILKADTIEELGEKIKQVEENKQRMDPKVLAATVADFNRGCAEGKDSFGRRKATLGPIEKGPFYAAMMLAGGPNTAGGLLCNGKREVLAWNGTPIPHLFAAGEIVSVLKFVYDDPNVDGEAVKSYLSTLGDAEISVFEVSGRKSSVDFMKILVKGSNGKSSGGTAPTLGIIGRLGGLGARPEIIGFTSDGDGALSALTAAAKLIQMSSRGDVLEGDVVVSTQICPSAPTRPHDPVPFMDSPVAPEISNKYEVYPEMDAVVCVDTTKGNRILNHRGIAATPTVKDGWILRTSEDVLSILETVTGELPYVLPITQQDITPYGNGLYHLNSILQPSVATDAPCIGLAVTTSSQVAGCATGATHLSDVDQAARFCVELAKSYTSGKARLYSEDEFELITRLYGSMSHLRTKGDLS